MANLKEIRGRIQSVKSTQQMTRAMKMVAAAKLRRAQDNILRLRPYALKLQEIMEDINSNVSEELDSPFVKVRAVEKVLLVVVTSNRGLCGAFNNNIIKLASQHISANYEAQLAAGNLEMLFMGKKAYEFFHRRKFSIIGGNHDVFANLNFETVSEISEMIMKGFAEKRWDKVEILYNEFKNVVVQNRVVEQFLPIKPATQPEQGKKAEKHFEADYLFEPDRDDILKELIPKSLNVQFYKAVLESNAGEQGARMSAMDSATENANELLKELRLQYNRARQANITKEILEIVGGAEALSSGG